MALAEAAERSPGDPMVESLMRALDDAKLFRYHNDGEIGLLSTTGRVLMAIIEDPTMTQRAISVYLGCSESLVDKTTKALAAAGLITKTKVNRKNVYAVDREKVENHSDIQHVGRLIEALGGVVQDDSAW
tara:strand:+ start:1314 stop:1703 length:390 start_codon:yes stop_codon:yes gene_type:complete